MASPPATPPKLFQEDSKNIHMASPPVSPSKNPQGSSCMTGGIFQGCALGNVFNNADGPELHYPDQLLIGKVLVYTTHVTKVSDVEPYMSFKHNIVNNLAPILEKLGKRFPLFQSEF